MSFSTSVRLCLLAALMTTTACAATPTPVQATADATGAVVINEVLAHTDSPQVDTVELHNLSTLPVDIGGWFLSDDEERRGKFKVPAGVTIPPGGYYLFQEDELGFRFSEFGERIILSQPDSQGKVGALADQVEIGASPNGVSLGRYVNSQEQVFFPLQAAVTLGTANAGPSVGPLVIGELMYHPVQGGEYVVVTNAGNAPAPLYDPLHPAHTWRLAGLGDDNGTYEFPAALTLGPGGSIVIAADPDAYRATYGEAIGVPVVGPFDGKLSNEGERIALQQPQPPETDPDLAGFVAYVDVDAVTYGVTDPWPPAANGQGPALVRNDGQAFGDDPANWRAGRQVLQAAQLAFLPLVGP